MSIKRHRGTKQRAEETTLTRGGAEVADEKDVVERGRDVLKLHEESIKELDEQIEIIMKRYSQEKKSIREREEKSKENMQFEEGRDWRKTIYKRGQKGGMISRRRNTASVIVEQPATPLRDKTATTSQLLNIIPAHELSQHKTPVLAKLAKSPVLRKSPNTPTLEKSPFEFSPTIGELSPICSERVQLMEDNRILEENRVRQCK